MFMLMRFCKLYTAISNLSCLVVLTSGFKFNYLLESRLTHNKNLSNLFFWVYFLDVFSGSSGVLL